MFFHNFKYVFKTALRNKSMLIWTFLFPIALSSFMYMAFGNLYEVDEVFHAIPVGVVKECENEALEATLDALSEEGEDQLLDVTYLEKEEAIKQLDEDAINGILYINEEIEIVVANNSYENTVLKTVVEEYKKREFVIQDILEKNPQGVAAAVEKLTADTMYYTEESTSDGNQDMYVNYFYAIFAMSCLFGSFAAIEKIEKLQANISSLGMRRCLSPNSKMVTVLAEFLSLFILQFVIEIITFVYLSTLGVNFGEKTLAIFGILAVGSCVGIAMGIVIGCISKFGNGAKTGIAISVSMTMSVLADLCASGVKDLIEHTMPIINRINPAALIVDSFYALNVYDTYDRYAYNMSILGLMAVVLLGISILMLRRNRYASL